MPPDQLAQLSEVANILGISRSLAARTVNRPDFPQPIDTLSSGRVWRRRDVEAWGRKNPRRPLGRPRKDG
jgi:predicted DNA-binding transcriptional regulator AlpA